MFNNHKWEDISKQYDALYSCAVDQADRIDALEREIKELKQKYERLLEYLNVKEMYSPPKTILVKNPKKGGLAI